MSEHRNTIADRNIFEIYGGKNTQGPVDKFNSQYFIARERLRAENIYIYRRVECGIFFIGQNRSSNQRSGSGMILKVKIQSSGARASVGARASKFLYSKKSRGLKYQYFFFLNSHVASFWV